MRCIPMLLLLPVLSCPAWAADPPKPDAPKSDTTAAHTARETWEKRFTDANVAHDGHLTPAEAKTGYALVAKHFGEIDVDHKGYVTENDIQAWRVARKAAHNLAKPSEDNVNTRPAAQRTVPDSQTPSAPPKQTVATGVMPTKP